MVMVIYFCLIKFNNERDTNVIPLHYDEDMAEYIMFMCEKWEWNNIFIHWAIVVIVFI